MNNFKRNIFRTVIEESTPSCECRHLNFVTLTSTFPNVITLQALSCEGAPIEEVWTVQGEGEQTSHTFNMAICIVETSLFIGGGTDIYIEWNDGIDCCDI